MQKFAGQILGVVVPLASVVALIILLMFALTRLAQIQHDMRNNVSANMLWVITQTQVKGLRVSNLLQHYLRDEDNAEQVIQAYRLLSSRFNLLLAGPQQRYLDAMEDVDGGAQLTDTIQAVRDAAAAASASRSGPDATKVMGQLLDALDNLDKRLAAVASRTMVAQWEEMGSRLDRYRNGVLTIIFLMLGICVCSFIITVHMFIALRRVRESEWAKRQALQLQSQLESERQVSELHRNFGAMVSHQFRTPLAIIDASMQRILRSGEKLDRAQLVRRVHKVRRATARLARLVEHTRIADQYSELLDVNLESSALGPLIESIVQQQREISPHRVIRFLVPADDTLPDACCDPMLVEHIVFNFLSNAIKYSAVNTEIQVAVFHEGARVCCEVRDRGMGLHADDVPYLFDRYFRGQEVADTPGTGMGLYVAYKLAQIQDGVVSAVSNPEGGSMFKVCFPVAKMATVATSEQESVHAASCQS